MAKKHHDRQLVCFGSYGKETSRPSVGLFRLVRQRNIMTVSWSVPARLSKGAFAETCHRVMKGATALAAWGPAVLDLTIIIIYGGGG